MNKGNEKRNIIEKDKRTRIKKRTKGREESEGQLEEKNEGE